VSNLIENPDAYIISEITNELTKTLTKLKLKGDPRVQPVTKKASFGDLCTPVFPLAKDNKKNPNELANEIASAMTKIDLIDEINAEGGFINYSLNRKLASKIILEYILANEDYFKSDSYKGIKIIVEHTSANPNGPIHIGNFRGSVIGDVYARLLKAVGADVKTHFYVDDLGHQIPVLVIGYNLLKKYNKVQTDVKIDHYLGLIYGITHTMYDIQRFKQEMEEKYNIILGVNPYWFTEDEEKALKKQLEAKKIPEKELLEVDKQFTFFYKLQGNIYSRFNELYDDIKNCLEKEKIDLPKAIPDLNRQYMNQEKEAVKKVRSTCEDVVKGHKEELAKMGITHDSFDWEADLQWSGKVDTALETLVKNGFIIKDGKARIFDSNKAADLEGAREYLGLKKTYEVPKAILITSTGDTLYLLRDIAYSLEKIDHFKADRVYNVIGKQQELTQRQLNLALRAIGRSDVANKILHLNYEYMELKGALTSMSARRLQYITPLELLNRTKEAVHKGFLKERDYPEDEKEKIAELVAVGAIKYSIIAVGLMKKMIFDPKEVISLSNNTSPFIQYAYARSQNILAKTDFKWKKDKIETLSNLIEDEEWFLIQEFAKMQQIVLDATEQIKPELLCSYLFDIANLFNKFYDNHRVLDADTPNLVTARLALTYITGIVLSKGLDLLGIESPPRM